MSKTMVHASSVEEKFMFGSPPLLNGFACSLNTCRSQEQNLHNTSSLHQDSTEKNLNETTTENTMNLSHNYGYPVNTQRRFNVDSTSQGDVETTLNRRLTEYSQSCANYPQKPFTYRNGGMSLVDNFNQMKLNGTRTTSHVDNGIKILEQAGIKIQNLQNNEPVFRKRKDLRTLKAVLSHERFREVVMKFGDGDEGGREIVESVHKAMKNSNLSSVCCLFCSSESSVYENFPVVDGTLFLTPVKLSENCVKFEDSVTGERHMGYICVKCMEGKSKTLCCSSCASPWNGSFFQIGTLYSYNILFAVPCCSRKVSCNKCHEPIIDLANGGANNLFFSHFSKKVTCQHCEETDYHYVKPLSTIAER